ncbi:hypothetical protein OAG71_01840, partial [bacterium]|nr:hypothetical protein [bacterium]
MNVLTIAAQQPQQVEAEETSERTLVTSAEDMQWLASELKSLTKHDGFTKVDAADVKKFKVLLTETLQLKDSTKNSESSVADLDDQWANLHWQVKRSPTESFFIIRELENHRHGRGVYAFRINAKNPIALQAPHRFSDLMTGTISVKLFSEHSISAIALNTVHRKEIDLSHTKLHYINAFTSAIIKAQHDIAIIQLHGFTNEGKTGAAQFAQAIISDTTKFPGRSARQTALEFKTIFGQDHTRLFPVDVQQLGGTTNRQAQIAHNLGCPDFLHIELNHEFRLQLKRDASVRDSFFASILRGIA